MGAPTIIIARDGGEADIISKNPLAQQHTILTLSPGAAAVFRDRPELTTIDTTAVYTDCEHAKSVVRQKNIQSEFRKFAQMLKLSPIQVEAVASTLFYMSGAASFYYQALRGFDKYYILNDNRLEEIDGFENAFDLITSRILKKRYSGRDHEFSGLHRWLMKTYNAHLDRMLKNKRKILIIDGSRPSSKNFAKEAVKLDPEIVILQGRNPVKSMLVALRHMRRSLKILRSKNYIAGRVPMYFFYPAKTRSYLLEATQMVELATPGFNKTMFTLAAPYIAEILRLAAGYEQQSKELVQNLQPEIIATDGLASGYTMSVAKYAREMGIKVVLFNHASHSPQSEAISKAIGNLWASFGILHSPFASHIVARSPAVAALSAELSGDSGNISGVRHDKKIPLKAHDKFKILFAGNYLNVEAHVPWMAETPDEFIKGIAELVEAVAQVPEAELTIRVKPGKKDFNAEIMQKFIRVYPNVIVSNAGTMKEALAETDLMVASISTTVEEALQCGRPVLLHSGAKRYRHLPSAKNGRSAVYASSKTVPLVECLRKIIAAHKDKPLNDNELAPYIWADSEADMQALAKIILDN